mgnify:CR=1 FL=1
MKTNISTAECPVCAKQGMVILADTINGQIICTVCQEAGLET